MMLHLMMTCARSSHPEPIATELCAASRSFLESTSQGRSSWRVQSATAQLQPLQPQQWRVVLYTNTTQGFDGLRGVLAACAEDASVTVYPETDEGVSYLRLATAVYSAVVACGKPKLDVVVGHWCGHPMEGHTGRSGVDGGVEVGADGYGYGDGSASFYDKYDVVVVGGTFDRLHAGHRLLLTAAAWASRRRLWIGVTSSALLKRKQYHELIASFEERRADVIAFARRAKPSLEDVLVSELVDGAGASAYDPTIEAMVVSRETAHSAHAINNTRLAAGLNRMAIILVDVLDTKHVKLSSSALRAADAADAERRKG